MYWCSVHKLDNQFESKHHMVQYEADISPGSEDVVHHMEVFHYQSQESGEFPVWTGSCSDENAPKELTQSKMYWQLGQSEQGHSPILNRLGWLLEEITSILLTC